METPNSKIAEAQVGFDAGTKVALAEQRIKHGTEIVGGIPFLLTQSGMVVKTIEETFPAPMARRGAVAIVNVRSFIELVKREYAEGKSVIFAHLPANEPGNITAIIDYHSDKATPSWCEYRIILRLSYTPEWMEWKKMLNTAVLQLALAEFLEERYIDVQETPNGVSGATILETALSLEAKKGVLFKQANALQNGDVSLQFEETTTARAGQKGELEIPKEFLLYIPVYEGFEASAIRVLLRFRINDGALTFVLKPVNLDRALYSIREAVIALIGEETELPVYLGDAATVPARKLQ